MDRHAGRAVKYAIYLPSLLRGPLAGPWTSRWFASVGAQLDALLDALLDAALLVGPRGAPADAVGALGADRRTPRMAGETAAQHQSRIRAAWETWSWATTDRGIRDAIVLGGFGSPTIYPQRLLPMPPRPQWWARFTVVFSGRGAWDGALAWDADGSAWDGRLIAPVEGMATAEARTALRGILGTWKGARDRVTAVILARGSLLYDTGETWDDDLSEWDEGDTPTELSDTWDDTASWDDQTAVFDYFL